MNQKKKNESHGCLTAIVLIVLYAVYLNACSSSSGGTGRNGAGPFDFTDYAALDARQDMREMSLELTAEAAYEDARWEEYQKEEEERYQEYLSDLMHERELREMEENGEGY